MIAFLNSRIRSLRNFPNADVPLDLGQDQKGRPGKKRPAAFAFLIPKASAPKLHQKNRLRPKSKTPCPISQPSAHAQRVSLCRFLRSQPRRIGLGHLRTGRDPDTPSFTISRLTLPLRLTLRPLRAAPLTASQHTSRGLCNRRKLIRFHGKTDERGDAVDRPIWQSSLLSDPNANFSVEMWQKSNTRKGRHVGLDFYDLLIEGCRYADFFGASPVASALASSYRARPTVRRASPYHD
jgi:hypothetical protein